MRSNRGRRRGCPQAPCTALQRWECTLLRHVRQSEPPQNPATRLPIETPTDALSTAHLAARIPSCAQLVISSYLLLVHTSIAVRGRESQPHRTFAIAHLRRSLFITTGIVRTRPVHRPSCLNDVIPLDREHMAIVDRECGGITTVPGVVSEPGR